MSDPTKKQKLWLYGEEATARRLAERHLETASIGLPTEHAGDRQDDSDGIRIGGVIWPVEKGTHGMRSFLTADAFLALYDKKAKKVYMMDDLAGGFHQGANPLRVGVDVDPLEEIGGYGWVFRAPEFGEEGLYNNIFVPFTAILKAHHLPPNPPQNSTLVYDEDGRAGGLHTPLRVREWLRKFCSGATSTDKDPLYAPLLNFGRNGDGSPAYGAVHFDRAEAALSDEARGPLAVADDGNHPLGRTGEARVHQGGINIREALLGDTKGGIIYSPIHFNPAQLPPRSRGPFTMFVEMREDYNRLHTNYCGRPVQGTKDWFAESIWREYPPPDDGDADPHKTDSTPKPPTITDPDAVKPGPPPEDTDPDPYKPLPVDDLPPWDWPPDPAPVTGPPDGVPPTAGTPYETESPSDYGHPLPGIPDGPPITQGNPAAVVPTNTPLRIVGKYSDYKAATGMGGP